MSCCGKSHLTPLLAARSGQQEKIIYITCARYNSAKPDYLATVDVDPDSPEYCQVIHRLSALHAGDEMHHSGWDVCSSCPEAIRTKLIMPCLNSSRIYVADVTDERRPRMHTVIEPDELLKLDVSFPHTTHCLPTSELLISTLGDAKGNAKGSFLSVDAKTFKVKGTWQSDSYNPAFNYDYWYQPYHDVMISTAWGEPNKIKKGFDLADVTSGKYGHSLYVWEWKSKKFVKEIDLGANEGMMPLEVRFKHDPTSVHGFVGCALSSTVFHIYRDREGQWTARKVIDVPSIDVQGWALPSMPGLITDIIVSLDDKYLFFSNWLQGDIRQYDISDPFHPVLVDRLFVSGAMCKGSGVTGPNQPDALIVKGKKIDGGPQMLQLSLDGKRLYVTTSLYSVWDNQFYPDLIKNGAVMLKINVSDKGMTLDKDFLVDFGKEPDGPIMAHEMRYPGGDCTSDIWLLPEVASKY